MNSGRKCHQWMNSRDLSPSTLVPASTFNRVFYHVLFCVTNMADGSQHEIRKFILVSTVMVFF